MFQVGILMLQVRLASIFADVCHHIIVASKVKLPLSVQHRVHKVSFCMCQCAVDVLGAVHGVLYPQSALLDAL